MFLGPDPMDSFRRRENVRLAVGDAIPPELHPAERRNPRGHSEVAFNPGPGRLVVELVAALEDEVLEKLGPTEPLIMPPDLRG